MDDKQELIKAIAGKLMRIINKQNRIEETPVILEEGVIVTPHGEPFHSNHWRKQIDQRHGPGRSLWSDQKRGFPDSDQAEPKRLRPKDRIRVQRQGVATDPHPPRLAGLRGPPTNAMAGIWPTLPTGWGAFSLSHIAAASVLLDVIEDVLNERLAGR